jgi:hypothetical protein
MPNIVSITDAIIPEDLNAVYVWKSKNKIVWGSYVDCVCKISRRKFNISNHVSGKQLNKLWGAVILCKQLNISTMYVVSEFC